MLKNVKLKNFQSHIDTEINLDKGVNCIVGSSDSGKSSIVRALKWLILNRPQGDAFKNNETKPKDTVSIECNGIIRKKNKKENSYVLNNETLKAIKTDVPQEIQNCLLMNEINLQTQHPNDQYFMLTDSPGQVAKKFNKVSGLEIMDKALYEINSQVRNCNTELKLCVNEIQDKKDNIKDLAWVDQAIKKGKVLIAYKKELKKNKTEKEVINDNLLELKNISNKLATFDFLNDAIKQVKNLQNINKDIQEYINKFDSINDIIKPLKKTVLNLNSYKGISKLQKGLETVILLEQKVKKDNIQRYEISDRLSHLENIQKHIDRKQKEINSITKEFKNELSINGCPLCGGV